MSWGGIPWAGDPDLLADQSTPNRLTLLLNDPTAKINIVMECNPRRFGQSGEDVMTFGGRTWGGAFLDIDLDMSDVGIVYLSSRRFVTLPSDTPPNKYMIAALSEGINYKAVIPEVGRGVATSSVGISVIGLNEYTDFLTYAAWAGTEITLKLGGKTGGSELLYREYETYLTGKAQSITFDESELRISVQDQMHRLDDVVQSNQYDGDGSTYEGDTNLAGVYKPRLFGDCFNVPGIVVNRIELPTSPITYSPIYQVHDGPISAITEVRAKDDTGALVVQTFDQDTTDLPGWSGSAGQYATDLSRGLFRVWTEPKEVATADVQGDTLASGYSAVAEDIITALLEEKGMTYDSSTFSFASQSIGLYTGTTSTSYADVLHLIANEVDGWIIQNRTGDIEMGQHSALSGTPMWTIEGRKNQDAPAVITEVIRIATEEPIYKVSIPYRRNYTLQKIDAVTPDIVEDNPRKKHRHGGGRKHRHRYKHTPPPMPVRYTGDEFSQKFKRTSVATKPGILSNFPDALEYEPETGGLFVNLADAEAIRDRIIDRYGKYRDKFKLTLIRPRFQIFVGDIIQFHYDRFGLDVGAIGECLSLIESDDDTVVEVITERLSEDAT